MTSSEQTIIGVRHERADRRECFCGCQFVDGHRGHVVQDTDTPKLAQLDPPCLIARFNVPYHGQVSVAYSYAEVGLTVNA